MQITYDLASRATYIRIRKGDVARTVDVSDTVMVDLDIDSNPLGVEFLTLPVDISPASIEAVVERFPVFKILRDPERWMTSGFPGRLVSV